MNKFTRCQFLELDDAVIGAAAIRAGWYPHPLTPPSAAAPANTQMAAAVPTSILLEGTEGTDSHKAEVEITYICNEGFLLTSSQGEKILIDALLAGFPPYGELSPEQRHQMEQASPPFDDVDLILITHKDSDHYDLELIRKHLQNDPQTILVSVENAASELKELFPDRVQIVSVNEWEREPFTFNGIELEVLGLRHSQSPYDYTHVGFLFTIGGRRMLHTGDFDNMAKLPPNLGKIAVAFVVYWAVPPPAKHIIQMHWDAPSPYMTMQTWTLK